MVLLQRLELLITLLVIGKNVCFVSSLKCFVTTCKEGIEAECTISDPSAEYLKTCHHSNAYCYIKSTTFFIDYAYAYNIYDNQSAYAALTDYTVNDNSELVTYERGCTKSNVYGCLRTNDLLECVSTCNSDNCNRFEASGTSSFGQEPSLQCYDCRTSIDNPNLSCSGPNISKEYLKTCLNGQLCMVSYTVDEESGTQRIERGCQTGGGSGCLSTNGSSLVQCTQVCNTDECNNLPAWKESSYIEDSASSLQCYNCYEDSQYSQCSDYRIRTCPSGHNYCITITNRTGDFYQTTKSCSVYNITGCRSYDGTTQQCISSCNTDSCNGGTSTIQPTQVQEKGISCYSCFYLSSDIRDNSKCQSPANMTNTEECLVGEICQAVITNTTLGTGESLISISRSCSWQPLNGCLYKEKTKTCYVFCDEDFCNKMNILSDSGNSVAPSSERTTSFSTTLEQTTVSANLTASYTATTTTTTTTTAVTAPETYFLTADQLTTGSTNLTSTNSEPTTKATHLTRSNATTAASTNYEPTTESPLGATYEITTQSSNLPQPCTTGTTTVSSIKSTTESTNLSESVQTTTITVSPSSYQPTNNIISPAESFPATTSSTSYQSVPATTNISTVTFSSTVPNHILNNTVSSSSAFSIPVILTVLTTKESPLQDSTTAMIINGQYESEAAASENVPSTAVNRNMNTLTIDSTAFNSLLGSASIRTSNIETTTQSTNMFPTTSQATSSQPIQAMVSSKHLQEIPDVSTSRDAQLDATHPETSITPNNIFTETATSPMQTETSDSYTTDQEIQDISNPTTTALNTFILTSEDGFSPTLTTVVGNEEATSTYERLSALPEVTTLTQSTIDQSTAVTSLLNTEQTTFITSRSNDKETSTMESQFTNETSTISAGEETTTESVSNTNSITHETFDGSTEQLVISSVSPTTSETLTTTPDTTMSNAVLASSEDFQSQQTTGDLTSETSITPTTVSNISSTSNENTNSTAQSTEDYSEVPRGLHMPTTSVQVENNSLFTESTQTIATNAEGSADFQSQPETTTSRFSASSDAQEATTNNVPQTSSLGWNSPEGSGNTASGNGNTEETTSQSTSLYTKLFNSTESVTHYDITDKNTMRTVPSHMLRNMHQTTDSSSDKIRSNFVFIFAISLFSLIIL